MGFYEVLDRVVALLRERGRVTYRGLKREFQLDDALLEDLKDELINAQRLAVDEGAAMLVWTGRSAAGIGQQAEAERWLHTAVLAVMTLLQREQRVTYRTLRQVLGVDDECLHAVRDELRFRRLAREEDGQGLVWTGEDAPRALHSTGEDAPRALHSTGEDAPRALHSTVAPAALPADDGASPTPKDVPGPTSAGGYRDPEEAERRQLTVLFCDLVGATQLSGHLDPEDFRAVVYAYQETATAVIKQYAGHISQYLGDGLWVYFGYPTAHEDDARRAVHTGLGILEAMATLNTRLRGQYGVTLAARLGIHTGPVVVGVMGGAERHERLAMGETLNIAARLEALAPPDAVVISSVTARLVAGTFALDDLGTHTLRGVAEPMAISRVRGLLAAPGPDEDIAPATVSTLVGREEESGLLLRHWNESKAGLGQVVFVSGEAGIGKSALVGALRAHVRAEGSPRVAFRCSPYHTASVLYPVITHLGHAWQLAADDAAATRLSKLEAGVRSSELPLAEAVPLFAGLLAVPLPADRYAPLTGTPQQQKQQTLDTVVAWLAAQAEREPVLAVWEDLHWADPTTLELLGLVIEQAQIGRANV